MTFQLIEGKCRGKKTWEYLFRRNWSQLSENVPFRFARDG
jgi:hypothetical protein